MHAVDIYGLSEVMGPGVANECVETKDGLHIWEDHFYPEIIDPATGKVLPDGERGELVFTSLTKEAMPVIRYRTRDLTRLMPGTARSMRRMEKITGRSDDMMIVRGVNVFPTQIEELILKDERLAPHFVIELRREERLDTMTVKVEARAGADDAVRAACERGSRASDQGADRRDGDGGDDAARAGSSARPARRSGLSICGPKGLILRCASDQISRRDARDALVHVRHERHAEQRRRQIQDRDRHERRDEQARGEHRARDGACAAPSPPRPNGSASRRAGNIRGRADRRSRRRRSGSRGRRTARTAPRRDRPAAPAAPVLTPSIAARVKRHGDAGRIGRIVHVLDLGGDLVGEEARNERRDGRHEEDRAGERARSRPRSRAPRSARAAASACSGR